MTSKQSTIQTMVMTLSWPAHLAPFIPIGRLSVSIAGSKRVGHRKTETLTHFLSSPSPLPADSRVREQQRWSPRWPEEIGVAAGPFVGGRARPWLSTSPSSGLAVVPCTRAPRGWPRLHPARRCGYGEVPHGGGLFLSARADRSFFVPRGGDAAGGMRAQVGPHS